VTDTLEDVMANTEAFENYVKNYFFGIKIEETVKNPKTGKLEKTGRRVLPKMGYSKNIKASLFGVFTKEYKLNLADPLIFPNHYEWWGQYMKFLKKDGKGMVTHKPRLHHRFNEKAMVLAYHCLKALQNRDNPDVLSKHQQHIPPSWMTKPHVIIQDFTILQMIQFGVRRGKEGLADLRVGSFKLVEDEIWGHKSWVKQTTELSKNHIDDEESVENSGQIPYLDLLRISEEEHFNPGKFFEDVRGFYSTETTDAHRMFMKPISNSKFGPRH